MLTTRMNSTRNSTVCRMSIPKRRVPRSNSVSSGRAARRSTMSPNAVSRPVANTTAGRGAAHDGRAEEDQLGESGPSAVSGPAVADFSAGSDSPVSAACCTCRSSRLDEPRVGRDEIAGGRGGSTSPSTSSRRGNSTQRRRAGPSRSVRPVAAAASPRARAERLPEVEPALSSTMAPMIAHWRPRRGAPRRCRRRAG